MRHCSLIRRSFFARPALALLAATASFTSLDAGEVTTPEAHLGRPVGGDFTLADWDEVRSYYEQLAAQSPRVRLEKIGETTLGRDMLLSIITSEENQGRLDEIREIAKKIADPRGLDAEAKEKLLEEGKVILFISPAMHSTETAAPQFGMEFAHLLATSDEEPFKTARERMVICMMPCTNPDGLDRVVHWYREFVGTPHEGTGLTELYQHYSGHDNNRDWFMLSQKETRAVTRQLYHEWFPQVYWDVHQQGRSSERMFVPPFRDPLDPNLDPAVISGINLIGTRALFDMTRDGFTGIGTGSTYDMWWNGGNRNVPVRHNIIGLLTEAASVNLASPVFLDVGRLSAPTSSQYIPANQFPAPWPGGWWRIRDIIDYELAFGESLLNTLSSEPKTWMSNLMGAAERAIAAGDEGAPIAWILPSDNRDVGAVKRLADILFLSGVEIHVARGEVTADGRTYPAGSMVIKMQQPYSSVVKDLFEVQRYPEGDAPYDVAGWTLPLLMGVRRVEVTAELKAELDPVTAVPAACASFSGRGGRTDPRRLDSGDTDSWKRVIEGLKNRATYALTTGGPHRGTIIPLEPGEAPSQGDLPIGLPRIGVYAPWSGSMDEGWLRWVLDEFEIPYTRVRNEMIRAGRLEDHIETLIIPSISGRQLDRGRSPGTVPDQYSLGLAPEGAVAIEQFVHSGGRLIATDRSVGWVTDLLGIGIDDVTQSAGDFSCPGSVLLATPTGDDFAAGLPASMSVFFSRSSAFKSSGDRFGAQTVLNYADTRVLLSGYLRGESTIAGRGAWTRSSIGEGSVHLFGFRPHYRSWSHGAFQLMFRALFLDVR